jgi:adenylate cyclase
LLDQPALAAADGQRRIMTMMFCDMKGFTTLSEGVTPQGLVKIMNTYLSTMSAPIHAHHGIIDKYVGDAIIAYWGPPFIDEAEQANAACLAAVDMVGRIAGLRKDLPELLGVRAIAADCDIRIGIATGEALVGSIGSEFMMSYTVMGATVNLASRLEGANKVYGSRCLISEATASAGAAAIEVREIDRVIVVGQTQAQTVFELMGAKGALSPEQMQLRDIYAEGLAAYRSRDWNAALAAFAAALAVVPSDGPSTALVSRIERLKRDPPSADWDGAWKLEYK